jgi:hypothetical protein
MGRIMRRLLVGQGNDTINRRGRQGRDAPGPGLLAGEPGDPLMHKAAVPAPSAVRTMIRARQTCFCGLLRSRMIDCKRARSSAVTVMEIPLRITDTRHSHKAEPSETPIWTLLSGATH